MAKNILNYVELDYVAQVDQWINENTHSESANITDRLNYNTAHDSKTTIRKWTTALTQFEISLVETHCVEMMKLFKYEKYTEINKI